MHTRLLTAIGGFMLILSIAGFLFVQTLVNSKAYYEINFYQPLIAVGGVFLAGVTLLMVAYLRAGQPSADRGQASAAQLDVQPAIDTLAIELQTVKSRLDAQISNMVDLPASERESLVAEVRSQIQKEASSDVLRTIEEKYSQQLENTSAIKDLETQCRRSEVRLLEEISSLTKRGNVNLIIGVITTLVAVGLLASTVVFDATSREPIQLATHFLPRFTLSLFIEFFSFFFLRLYSTGLGEIKYFQNELTNLESKFIALRRATQSSDRTSQSKILQILANTERNFVLKKGDSTVDIERARLEQQSNRDLVAALAELVKQKKV